MSDNSPEQQLIRSLEKHRQDSPLSKMLFYIGNDEGELVRTEDADEWIEFWKKQEGSNDGTSTRKILD